MKSPSLTLHQNLDPNSILALFSALGDVYFFMKDREGHLIGANDLQLEKLGLKSEDELIGKTDCDFFPSYMTAHYAKDDAQVMDSGEPILRRVELVANPDGSVSWHITSKFPLYDKAGHCVGIIGCMRDFDRSDNVWQSYRRMNAVVDYINEHYAEAIEMADLAQVASLSISQFERRFRTVFEQTPSRFLIRYRLTRASQKLMHSDDTVSHIAQEVGFYDHSHFTREFQKLFGSPPGRYRKAHRSPERLKD
jgi:PAS domain S-box-containing protein